MVVALIYGGLEIYYVPCGLVVQSGWMDWINIFNLKYCVHDHPIHSHPTLFSFIINTLGNMCQIPCNIKTLSNHMHVLRTQLRYNYKTWRHIVTPISTSEYGEKNCFMQNLGSHDYLWRAWSCIITPKHTPIKLY